MGEDDRCGVHPDAQVEEARRWRGGGRLLRYFFVKLGMARMLSSVRSVKVVSRSRSPCLQHAACGMPFMWIHSGAGALSTQTSDTFRGKAPIAFRRCTRSDSSLF